MMTTSRGPDYYEMDMDDGYLTGMRVNGRDLGLPMGPKISFNSETLPILLCGEGREVFSFWGHLQARKNGASLSFGFSLQAPETFTMRPPACERCGGQTEIFLGTGEITVTGETLCEHCARWDGTQLELGELLELRK